MITPEDRARGCLVGLAAGDAVGTTVEFSPRGTFTPLTDMVGGGPFNLKAGQWTDDTSMALCLATSLLEKGFDPADQMDRYCRWMNEGHLSSNGRCFDIGNTVREALWRHQQTGDPLAGSTDPYKAGNGSIMRLAPVVLYFAHTPDEAERCAGESSKTTHGAPTCIDACRLMARMLLAALGGASKADILNAGHAFTGAPEIEAIARGTWRNKTEAEIKGSGYVVHSLEAAVWCFATTETFEAAILKAANLGDDADTTAAICGQIAGAHYGINNIPEWWRLQLTWLDQITAWADALYASTP